MKPITEQEQLILSVLEYEHKIPTSPYVINEEHLLAYMHGYVHILGKTSFNLKPSDYRYARKLAGLSLMKHNWSLGKPSSEEKSGIVYLVENPAYPDHYKIGMTTDLDIRLNQYQTYDPFRQFAVKCYDFVLSRRHTETIILNSFRISLEGGEWALKKNCEKVFRASTFKYDIILA